MKAFIGVILILVVTLCGWLFIYDFIEKDSFDFVHSLSKISQKIEEEDWNTVHKEFIEVKKKWKRRRNILSILIDHHEIDNIDLAVSRADKYIDTKNKPLSLGEIEVLKQLFNIVKENEALTLTNIL